MNSNPVFKPAWWLPGPHLQTLWPWLMTSRPRVGLTRERFELSDGDFVDLFWTQGPKHSPIILLLHGLEGAISSHYIQRLLTAIVPNHWRALVMHFRGCGGTMNRLTRSYHSGDTGDIHAVIQAVKQREPDTPIASIGFSLGANVLLKYLGEQQTHCRLNSAVAVSVPFELNKTVAKLQHGVSRIYQHYLLSALKKSSIKKFTALNASHYAEQAKFSQTLRAFDNSVTAPLHGFRDANDYYQRCSSRAFLPKITVPTLIIHAKDDPFNPPQFDGKNFELSSSIQFELTANGGHVGFIGGPLPWCPQDWLARRIPAFLSQYLV